MSEYLQSLFVDSKFRSSGAPTAFDITLPENLNTNGNTAVSCISVSFPVTFWTVEEGLRDQLALELVYYDPEERDEDMTHLVIQLIPGHYDGFAFAKMLQDRINTWLPVQPTFLPWFECLYIPSENRLGISWDMMAGSDGDKFTAQLTRSWRFWSAAQLKGQVFSATPQIFPQRIASAVFNLPDEPPIVRDDEPYISGYYDSFAGISVVYLKSDLTTFRNIGPRVGGEPGVDRSVLARIPIQTDRGTYCHWSSNGYSYMWSSVQHSAQKQLRCWLTDADGNPLELHGGNVSAHLLFHDT